MYRIPIIREAKKMDENIKYGQSLKLWIRIKCKREVDVVVYKVTKLGLRRQFINYVEIEKKDLSNC